MWSILTAAWSLVVVVALARPHEQVSEAVPAASGGIEVLEYNRDSGSTTFSLGCFNIEGQADDSLVIPFQVLPSDLTTSSVVFNGQHLDILWEHGLTGSAHFWLDSERSTAVSVELSWVGFLAVPPPSLVTVGDEAQIVRFILRSSVGSSSSFTAVMRPNAPGRLVGLMPHVPDAPIINFETYADSYSAASSQYGGEEDITSESDREDEFDLAGEMETLRLLETHATRLNAEISARKKAIAYVLKQDQDNLCIKHLVNECEGVVCAAKAILRRVCDKAGIRTHPYFGLAKQSRLQEMMAFQEDEKLSQNCTSGNMHQSQAMMVPLTVTKNATYNMQGFHFDLAKPPSPLIQALSIIAAILGITALIAFIKRRCMSLRKRVDRAAAREERINARAYRRAARRALMRKRWDNFVKAINCFKSEQEQRIEDYEEKRNLILQDAFLEQDLDQAEKGEVMEAEIRELRYAHEIVSSLVRVDENHYALVTPVNDPPPPLVPLPYTPRDSRSRANSTYTLPSYTSETLPDYSSRRAGSSTSNSVVDGYTPPTSDSRGRDSPISPISESSRCTRFTPTSSVLEMSPRPSEETLRTRPSGDSRRDR